MAMQVVFIAEDTFGHLNEPGNPIVRRFTLSNKLGTSVQIISHGATITSLKVPDRNGVIEDVVLGFDDIEGYLSSSNPYFGATIGRVANRIAKGQFSIGNQSYLLKTNNGPNHLHGGLEGFNKRLWDSHVEGQRLTFGYVSRDGEEGYPGEVLATVAYELTPDNQLIVQFQATSTKPTPINLTNHSYFNLSGHNQAGNQLKNHFIYLNADHYTPVDSNLIPTGELRHVQGTNFDFRSNKKIHELLREFPPGNNGYDHNFCINRNEGESLRLVARVQEQSNGRILEVHSDQPGVQFYSGNFQPDKDSIVGKHGCTYLKHGGFCLETQNYPNAINQPNFPDPIVKPGEVYSHKVIYKFFSSP